MILLLVFQAKLSILNFSAKMQNQWWLKLKNFVSSGRHWGKRMSNQVVKIGGDD